MPVSLHMGDQRALLQWAAGRMPGDDAGTFPAGALAVGIVKPDGEIVAVLVCIETYDGILDIHFASDGSGVWSNRNVLSGLFGYVFLVCRAFRVQSIIPVDAPTHHSSILLRLGFRAEGTMKNGIAPFVDGTMFGMAVSDCPWLEPQDKEFHYGKV